MTVTGFSLAELRTAYAAVRDGTFTTDPHLASRTRGGPDDVALTPRSDTVAVVGVVGVSGGVGATVVALAVAEALGASRLVELSDLGSSGLAAASSAELGNQRGWTIGTRGSLRLERRRTPDAVLLKPSDPGGTTVMDFGVWPEEMAVATVGVLVVVAGCSVPSVRRLEARLELLDASIPVVPVITRVPGRSLPRPVSSACGPLLRAAAGSGRLVVVPECSSLRVGGVTSGPLPRRLQSAVGAIVSCVEEVS